MNTTLQRSQRAALTSGFRCSGCNEGLAVALFLANIRGGGVLLNNINKTFTFLRCGRGVRAGRIPPGRSIFGSAWRNAFLRAYASATNKNIAKLKKTIEK
jgi:hypothetical protein